MTAPKRTPWCDEIDARPRCTDGDRRKRSELVGVRFTPDELADAKTLAARHGLSVPELLRIGLNLLSASEMPR